MHHTAAKLKNPILTKMRLATNMILFTFVLLMAIGTKAMYRNKYKPHDIIPGCRTTTGCCRSARGNVDFDEDMSVTTKRIFMDSDLKIAWYWCKDTRSWLHIPRGEISEDGPFALECKPDEVLIDLYDVPVDEEVLVRTPKTETTSMAFCVLKTDVYKTPEPTLSTGSGQCLSPIVTYENQLLLAWTTIDTADEGLKLGKDFIQVPNISIYGPETAEIPEMTTFRDVSAVVMRTTGGGLFWVACTRNPLKFPRQDHLLPRLHVAVMNMTGEFY